MKKITNQKEQVLAHLLKRSLSMPEAVSLYNIYRLAQYIYLLRNDGYKIKSTDVKFKTRYGNLGYYSKYTLVK